MGTEGLWGVMLTCHLHLIPR